MPFAGQIPGFVTVLGVLPPDPTGKDSLGRDHGNGFIARAICCMCLRRKLRINDPTGKSDQRFFQTAMSWSRLSVSIARGHRQRFAGRRLIQVSLRKRLLITSQSWNLTLDGPRPVGRNRDARVGFRTQGLFVFGNGTRFVVDRDLVGREFPNLDGADQTRRAVGGEPQGLART